MHPWLSLRGTVQRGARTWRWTLRSTAPRIAVHGPSGCGKSTLLRLLVGLERLRDGTLSVHGQIWDAPERQRRLPPWERRVGWLPQDASLLPHLSAHGNLHFARRLPEADATRIAAWLELDDALLSRPAPALSGGERQRVALGRALLRNPSVLLLDEPFSGQDPERTRRMLPCLSEHLLERRIRLVLVVHQPAVSEALDAERWSMHEDGSLQRSP